ncbi:MAG: hypothetical protein QXU18_11930 [Thermoplasmatales archaeon]
MYIILADAELELIPDELKNEDEVKSILKKKGKETALLDNYELGYSISKRFHGYANRMGFPHIAYVFAKLNEESVLNETTELDYAIHTKNDVIIRKSDLSGIGAGYNEFAERVEHLLLSNPKRMSLLQFVKTIGGIENTVVLHPKGKSGLVVNDEMNYIIGGFPEGNYMSDLGLLEKFSIYDREITVPGVLELLHFKLFQTL